MDDSKQEPPSGYDQTYNPTNTAGSYPGPYEQPARQYGQPAQPYGHPAQPYGQPTQTFGQPVQTGYGQTVVVRQPMGVTRPIGVSYPRDYMISSILACLCCFCPTGIFAIYYANRRNDMLQQGDLEEAHRSADCARNLIIASVVVGVCWIIAVVVIRAVAWNSIYGSRY